MTDRDDPLDRANPVSREQIEVMPLHGARRELLGEIMSTPGINHPSSPRRGRVLLPVAAAAVIAILAGGVWFVASGGGGDTDSPPVAASSTTASGSTTPDASPTATRNPALLSRKACAALRNRSDVTYVLVSERRTTTVKGLRRSDRYAVTRKGRWVEIGGERCRYVAQDDPVMKLLRDIDIPKGKRGGIAVVMPPARQGGPAPTRAPTTLAPSPSAEEPTPTAR